MSIPLNTSPLVINAPHENLWLPEVTQNFPFIFIWFGIKTVSTLCISLVRISAHSVKYRVKKNKLLPELAFSS